MLRALVLLLVSAPLLAGQDAGDRLRALEAEVQAARTLAVEEVLARAGAWAAGVDEDDAALLARVDALLSLADSGDEHGRLFLYVARMRAGDHDRLPLLNGLLGLLGSREDAVAEAAAQVLADPEFRELRAEDRRRLVEALTAAAGDANRAPGVRLDAAVALHAQGGVDGQRVARREMMDFLSSSDPELRALGALTLAEVGDIETGRTELRRLAAVPGERGRLAAAYLKQDDIRRHYDRRERNLILNQQQAPPRGADTPRPGDLERVENLIRMVQAQSLEGDQHKREDLIEAALDGLLGSLDEHSSYLSPKNYARFEQDLLSAQYGGIGAYVQEDPLDHLFTITRPIYSGPAYKAGLSSDDKIVRIEDWPTFGPDGCKDTDEIIKRLKGQPGTSVKIYVWRRGMDPALIDRPTEDMAVTVVREQISIPPVNGTMLPGGIGLVELTTFSRVATQMMAEEIERFQKQGLRALVLDLRANSGGLLEEACDVAGLFLPEGKLVARTESRIERNEDHLTQSGPLVPLDLPLVVVVDRYSASASEIVAGALQDYGRATIVGQQTFGKGSVQRLLPIPGEPDDEYRDENRNRRHDTWEPLTRDYDGDGEFDFGPRARMTVARYLLPSGRSIHREKNAEGRIVLEGGVEPDEKIGPRRFEAWKLEEFYELQKERRVRDWVEAQWPAHQALLVQLAECDLDDPQRYPGFDAFYRSLTTRLAPDDVRFLVRREVRRKAQDVRGAAFPDGDFQEDPMLQKAIRVLLGDLQDEVERHPEYAATFDETATDGDEDDESLAWHTSLSDLERSEVQTVIGLIDDARARGQPLTAEKLAEVERVLRGVLDKKP